VADFFNGLLEKFGHKGATFPKLDRYVKTVFGSINLVRSNCEFLGYRLAQLIALN
jgi:hypothetical protein